MATLLGGCIALDEDDHDDHAHDSELFEAAYEEAQQDGKADGTDCSGVRVPDRSGFNKRIALTFDDGPNPVTTPKVIEVLKQHQAPATFFTNGSRYTSPEALALAAQIATDPDFILANHSHRHKNLATLPRDSVVSEIALTDAYLIHAGETAKYFRFPFGSSTCETMKIAKEFPYTVVGWHIDSADWCYAVGKGVCKKETFRYVTDELRQSMASYVLSQVRAWKGGIVLFHDIHANTAASLDAVLTALEAEGYTFARLDDVTLLPKLNGYTPPPPPPLN